MTVDGSLQPDGRNQRSTTNRSSARFTRIADWVDRIVPFHDLRPLARIPSLKLKLSLVILAAVGVTIATTTAGLWLNIRPRISVAIAAIVALTMVQVLARGMTAPLDAMARAAGDMADGSHPPFIEADRADEIGQLADAFNVMATRIDALEQQRRGLIANVSHELRTPLAVLQGTIENLADGIVDDQAATLEVMARQVGRLDRLVSQLLDLSRLDAGVAPFHPAPMDLALVVHAVVAEAMLRTPAPSIVVDVAQEVRLVGDPERIHQVVANLVDNAIRHGPPGSPIEVAIRCDAQWAELTVRDQGPGIAPDRLDGIFERYDRAGAVHDSSGGLGLGLAITRWVAELHDGEISVTNTEPGCRFSLRLPTEGPIAR